MQIRMLVFFSLYFFSCKQESNFFHAKHKMASISTAKANTTIPNNKSIFYNHVTMGICKTCCASSCSKVCSFVFKHAMHSTLYCMHKHSYEI